MGFDFVLLCAIVTSWFNRIEGLNLIAGISQRCITRSFEVQHFFPCKGITDDHQGGVCSWKLLVEPSFNGTVHPYFRVGRHIGFCHRPFVEIDGDRSGIGLEVFVVRTICL